MNNKIDVFERYPNWLIEDIKKMAERVGSQAYSLITTKYGIPLEEVNEIVKQVGSVNGRTSASKPEDLCSNQGQPAK